MRICRRFLICVGCLIAISACDTIPREALNAYVSAFDETQKAGELLVHDFAAAKAEFERREAARKPAPSATPQPEIPLAYSPPVDGTQPVSATDVRLLAWEVIGNFNAALAALSAGESVTKVKATTERLAGAANRLAAVAGAAIPGVGAFTAAAQEIAAALEKARLSGEFRKAIAAGVPTVRKMLSVMIADTGDHYRLRAALALEDLVDIDDKDKVKRERIKGAISELKQSLDRFVLLARKCDESLVALQAATEKPMDFVAYSNELFALALTMRSHWAAYQSARIEGAR